MNCAVEFCCICFDKKEHLHRLSDSDGYNITYFIKLTSCVPEMCFNEMNDQRFACKICCETIDSAYKFRQKCLRSKNKLIDYISQLHKFSYMSGSNVKGNSYFETQFNTEPSLINLKVGESGDNYMKIENVTIKMENENSELVEENVDDPLENQDDVTVRLSQNDMKLMVVEKEKKSENQKFGEHENLNDIFVKYNSLDDIRTKFVENSDYLQNGMNYSLMNQDEINIDIVKNDIELMDGEINMVNKSKVIETISKDYVISLQSQDEDKTNKGKIYLNERDSGSSIDLGLLEQRKDSAKHQLCDMAKKKAKKTRSYVRIDPEQLHECSVCKMNFKLSSNLTKHMLIHTGEKPYQCNVCKKKFSQSNNLTTHMLIHTGEKPHECNICKMKFRLLGHLTMHMLIHTGEKPYECNICKKAFRQSSCLTKHMLTHSGEESYECTVCNEKFRLTSILAKHMLIHTAKKHFECDVCKRKFIQLAHLITHMLIHTGEQPYECDVCKKKFRQLGNLTKHMLIHTGEKPYECVVCKKKIRHSNSLKKHMLIHTGEKTGILQSN